MRQALAWVWQKLCRWDVTAFVISILYAGAVTAMYGDDYGIAACLYAAAIGWITFRALAWKETREQRQRGKITAIIVALALFWLGGSLRWEWHRYSASPRLVGVVGALQLERLYRFYQHPPVVFEPIDTELCVVLTNQTGKPIYVQGYSVSALVEDHWQTFNNLFPLGLEPDEIGMMSSGRIGRIDLSKNGFDYLIRQKPIGSNEEIEGWMFFNSGLLQTDRPKIKRFEITIIDSAQERHTFVCDYPGPQHACSFRVLPSEPIPPSLREQSANIERK